MNLNIHLHNNKVHHNMQNELNLSSIDSSPHSGSNSLHIQEIGNQASDLDSNQFRQNIREVLFTQKQTRKSQGGFNEEEQTFKGSFLQEMEKLGKSLSFESDAYNIYQGVEEGQFENNILAEIIKNQPSYNKSERIFNPFMGDVPAIYIIDFNKKKKKTEKRFSSVRPKQKDPSLKKQSSTIVSIKSHHVGLNSTMKRKKSNKSQKCSVRNSSSQFSSVIDSCFLAQKGLKIPKKSKKQDIRKLLQEKREKIPLKDKKMV